MGRKYTDNALTTLASGINAGSTTLTVLGGTGNLYPAVIGHGAPGAAPDFFVITMEDAAGNKEKMRVEQRAVGQDILGSAGFPLVRGFDGTIARAWNAGDLVDLRVDRTFLSDVDDKAQGANKAFGIRGAATSGLNFGYFGATVLNDGVLATIADGAVALTPSTTNFIERTYSGVVSANVVGFSSDKIPLYQATTDTTGITSFIDERAEFHFSGRIGKSVAGGVDVALSRAESSNEIIELTGILTGNINVVLPVIKRAWVIKNSTTGAFTVTVKTAGGAGVTITQGKTAFLFCDGTAIFDVISFLSALNIAGALSVGGALDVGAEITGPVVPKVVNGRLTLTSGVPVTVADVAAAVTLFFTPCRGNSIALYTGTVWKLRAFAELSIAVPNVANQVYDVFCTDDSGNPALELVAWTNDTARATALVLQDGVLVKTGDAKRRYVGTFRTTAVAGQTEDSLVKRYVWNYYNRAVRKMRVTEAAATWHYENTAYRQANGNAANQLDMVIGVSEEVVVARVACPANWSQPGLVQAQVGVGVDSTTVDSSDIAPYNNVTNGQPVAALAFYAGFPGIGRHFLAWIEATETGAPPNVNFYGTTGAAHPMKSGISGELLG